MKKKITLLIVFVCSYVGLQAQSTTHTWDFTAPVVNNKADGWDIHVYGNPNTANGILNLTATPPAGVGYCNLTYNVPSSVVIDPAVSKIFKIRVKNGTKDRRTNFTWTNEYGESKMEVIMTTEDANFKEYSIDLTHDLRWKGTISKLVIQLPLPVSSASAGSIISIDYFRLTSTIPTASLPALVPKTPAPFGVNLSGGEFAFGRTAANWRYPRQQELDYLQAKGFKLIRLPFLWERIQPVLNGPLDEESLSQLKNLVWAARTRGMYVVLDLHNYNRRKVLNGPLVTPPDNADISTYIIGTPEAPISSITDLWSKLADEFKGFDNIYAYGIMNEPYSVPRDIPWVNTAQEIIDAIRTKDTAHTIMVGGESYSSATQWPSVSDNLRRLNDPSNDLMYEAHIYFDKFSSGEYSTYEADNANPQIGVNRVTPFVEWLKKYNLRGYMGEYGIPHDDPRWNTVLENTLIYLKQNGVNGTYWSYGTSWGTYPLHVYPDGGVDRPQMAVLQDYLFANAPSALPGINSPLSVNYRIGEAVNYTLSATNNPTSFTVTQLPSTLSYNTTTKKITGTVPVGIHTIKISGTNASGTGEVRDIIFRGIDLKIPGIIQAEDYNTGGQNIGYYDKSIGNGGNFPYRDEDVDLRRMTTSPPEYAITHTIAGEWMKYTANVEQASNYSVKLRYATITANGKINLKIDGALVAGNINLPTTANMNTWNEVTFQIPTLSLGTHVITVETVSGGFDLDRMEFSAITGPGNDQYAYWAFDETTGATVTEDSWGTNDGIPGSSVLFVNGKYDKALRLDGSTNAYVALPTGLMSGINDFTITTWYQQTANVNWARIFDFGEVDNLTSSAPNSSRKYMYLTARNGTNNKVRYVIRNGGSDQQIIDGNIILSNNQWYHIALTRSGSTTILYVNGLEAGRNENMTMEPADFLTNINYIGRSRFTADGRLNGTIDDFKIFNRALATSEIVALHQSTLPVSLMGFTGTGKPNGEIVLNWSTQSESNNSHFEIMRSTDGKSFDYVSNVQGNDKSSVPKNYKYVDYMPYKGINYYQLKQVDLNGESSGFPKLLMVSTGLNKSNVNIYSVNGKLKLQVNATQVADFTLRITDLSGREQASFAQRLTVGSNAFEFGIEFLTRGVYVASYQSGMVIVNKKILIE